MARTLSVILSVLVFLIALVLVMTYFDVPESNNTVNLTGYNSNDLDMFKKDFDELNETYTLLRDDFGDWMVAKDELLSSCVSDSESSDEWSKKLSSYNPSTDLGFGVNVFGTSIKIDYPGGTELGVVNIWCLSRSMHPTLGCDDKVFGYIPKKPSEIGEGDIIVFKENFYDVDNTVHRVIAVEVADGKTFYTAAGDSLGGDIDSQKISFRDVKFKVLGVVYG